MTGAAFALKVRRMLNGLASTPQYPVISHLQFLLALAANQHTSPYKEQFAIAEFCQQAQALRRPALKRYWLADSSSLTISLWLRTS